MLTHRRVKSFVPFATAFFVPLHSFQVLDTSRANFSFLKVQVHRIKSLVCSVDASYYSVLKGFATYMPLLAAYVRADSSNLMEKRNERMR